MKTKNQVLADIKGNDILRKKKIIILRGRGLLLFQHVSEASSCKGSWARYQFSLSALNEQVEK